MSIHELLVRPNAVYGAMGCCKTTVRRQVLAGTFPSPIKLTTNGRATAYVVSEVKAVIDARTAGLDDTHVRALVHRLHAARGALSHAL